MIRNYVRSEGDSLPPTISTFIVARLRNSDALVVSDLNAALLRLKLTDVDTNGKLAVHFLDRDQDGLPNFTDRDDDGDGYRDSYEISMDTDPFIAASNPGSEPFIITVNISADFTKFEIKTNPI